MAVATQGATCWSSETSGFLRTKRPYIQYDRYVATLNVKINLGSQGGGYEEYDLLALRNVGFSPNYTVFQP
jgi:hypothetical protein